MARDVRLIRSPISIAGMVLTTISAVLFLVVFFADLLGLRTNPYLGIVFFFVLPALFVVGLLLIPAGALVERRRRAAGKAPSALDWPRIDFNNPVHRTTAVVVFGLTLVNIIIVSLAAYGGVEYMDSVEFCGQVCHAAMQPEFVAHQQGPHAQVKCVTCHVGSSAASFAKTKLAGVRRVMAVTFQEYSRPIVAASDQLLSARDTCEQCHRRGQPHGDRIVRITEFGDDEKNTESVTILRLPMSRIHWHADPANAIEYVATDTAQQMIPYVRMTNGQGLVREWVVEGVAADEIARGDRRRMDCLDCHNYPSHQVAATPERAVNEAMARGTIPRTLPFIHREAVKALKVSHASEETAMDELARALGDFYRAAPLEASATRAAEVEQAIRAVQDLYRRNVFPEMNVGFGTYVSHIGHIDSPGCFRCHDDDHKTKDGRTIGQECDTCHAIE